LELAYRRSCSARARCTDGRGWNYGRLDQGGLRLELDAAGDIVGTWCDARPRSEGKTMVPTPWAGTYGDYAVVGGVRVPTRGEVRWELPDGPFVYWRGTITSLELDPPG